MDRQERRVCTDAGDADWLVVDTRSAWDPRVSAEMGGDSYHWSNDQETCFDRIEAFVVVHVLLLVSA